MTLYVLCIGNWPGQGVFWICIILLYIYLIRGRIYLISLLFFYLEQYMSMTTQYEVRTTFTVHHSLLSPRHMNEIHIMNLQFVFHLSISDEICQDYCIVVKFFLLQSQSLCCSQYPNYLNQHMFDTVLQYLFTH